MFSAGFTWRASALSTGGGGVGGGVTRAMDRQLLRLLLRRSSTFRYLNWRIQEALGNDFRLSTALDQI